MSDELKLFLKDTQELVERLRAPSYTADDYQDMNSAAFVIEQCAGRVAVALTKEQQKAVQWSLEFVKRHETEYGPVSANYEVVMRSLLAASRPAADESAKPVDGFAEALMPLASIGGPNDMQAYHDLDDDVVVYSNSGGCITAGDVRNARRTIATITGVPVSEMHLRTLENDYEPLSGTGALLSLIDQYGRACRRDGSPAWGSDEGKALKEHIDSREPASTASKEAEPDIARLAEIASDTRYSNEYIGNAFRLLMRNSTPSTDASASKVSRETDRHRPS